MDDSLSTIPLFRKISSTPPHIAFPFNYILSCWWLSFSSVVGLRYPTLWLLISAGFCLLCPRSLAISQEFRCGTHAVAVHEKSPSRSIAWRFDERRSVSSFFFSCLRVSSPGGSFFLFTPSSFLCQEQEDVALHLSAAFVFVHSP